MNVGGARFAGGTAQGVIKEDTDFVTQFISRCFHQNDDEVLASDLEKLGVVLRSDNIDRMSLPHTSFLNSMHPGLPEWKGRYNRIQPSECVAALYQALKLQNVGSPDEFVGVNHLPTVNIGGQPSGGACMLLTTYCTDQLNGFFKDCLAKAFSLDSISSIEVYLVNRNYEDNEQTSKARMVSSRGILQQLILEIEKQREEVWSASNKLEPALRNLLTCNFVSSIY